MSDYDSWILQTPEEYAGISVADEMPFEWLVCVECDNLIEFFNGEELPENFDKFIAGTDEFVCSDCLG